MRLPLTIGAFVLVAFGLTIPAPGQTAKTHLDASVDALDAWLGGSEYGPTWHEYLLTDKLKEEMAKGSKADTEALNEVLDRYKSRKYGLSRPHFVAVRDAIDDWLAEMAMPPADELQDLATNASDQISPLEPARKEQAKKALDAGIDVFDRFLKRGGQAKEEGWKEFLDFEDLQYELKQDEPHYDTLVQVWATFAGGEQGLTHPRFATMRELLRNYLENAELFRDEQSPLTQLPQRLEAVKKSANEQTIAELGETLGWLERTGQAEDVVAAIRFHHSRPNMFIEASDRLVTYGFGEDIDQTDPVRDYSGGNSTTGNSRTVAKVTSHLSPNGSRGEVRLEIKGVSNSSTSTYNNAGVSFNTVGVTQIDGSKSVYFSSEGLVADPARIRCTTDNTTSNIRANSAQVESVARQRIASSERSNERQASRQAEQRIGRNLDQSVRKQLAEANDDLNRDFFGAMARRGVQPRLVKYHSSADTLFNTMILAAPEHLGAPNGPPSMKADGDLVARVHESWVNNLADIVLRGTTMTDEDLAETLEEWRGEVPEELQITDDSEPWDITFASRRPVRFSAGNESLSITLRGESFTARDRVMYEPMHISVDYRIERKDGKVALVREGDVEITFPAQGDKLSVRYLTLRNFWKTKFEALFEKRITELDLRLRGAWEAAGPLKLTALGARDGGWIGMAWEMPSKPADD